MLLPAIPWVRCRWSHIAGAQRMVTTHSYGTHLPPPAGWEHSQYSLTTGCSPKGAKKADLIMWGPVHWGKKILYTERIETAKLSKVPSPDSWNMKALMIKYDAQQLTDTTNFRPCSYKNIQTKIQASRQIHALEGGTHTCFPDSSESKLSQLSSDERVSIGTSSRKPTNSSSSLGALKISATSLGICFELEKRRTKSVTVIIT